MEVIILTTTIVPYTEARHHLITFGNGSILLPDFINGNQAIKPLELENSSLGTSSASNII